MSYSPTLGRWTQADPKGYVDGLNLYEGFSSNPVARVDPMGTDNDLVTPRNIETLATILKSEASIGNNAERFAVGATVVNRCKRNKTNNVKDVARAYATNQKPTPNDPKTPNDTIYYDLAETILSDGFKDPTGGATHYYSPRSMPMEGDDVKGSDVKGGLEQTPGLRKKNYKPGWANTFDACPVPGVREPYFKFYKQPGTGRVR